VVSPADRWSWFIRKKLELNTKSHLLEGLRAGIKSVRPVAGFTLANPTVLNPPPFSGSGLILQHTHDKILRRMRSFGQALIQTMRLLALRYGLHFGLADRSTSLECSSPTCGLRFLRRTEPSPTSALIHPNLGVERLVRLVVNPFAIVVYVSLDRAIRRGRAFSR
jgi:hypothetical protein